MAFISSTAIFGYAADERSSRMRYAASNTLQRIERQRVHQRIRAVGHLGRVDGAMLQRAARAQHPSARISSEASGRFHQDMNGSRTRREPPDRQPGRHQQHDQRGQQHALVALPQHGPDFLRVQQIDEVQAVRARVVFGDELRRGNFQQHVQHPPDAEPPGGRARPRRGGRTTARTPRAARSPWTAGTSMRSPPTSSGARPPAHAVPLPESQAQAAERQQRQHRQDESQGQAAHQAAPGRDRGPSGTVRAAVSDRQSHAVPP